MVIILEKHANFKCFKKTAPKIKQKEHKQYSEKPRKTQAKIIYTYVVYK